MRDDIEMQALLGRDRDFTPDLSRKDMHDREEDKKSIVAHDFWMTVLPFSEQALIALSDLMRDKDSPPSPDVDLGLYPYFQYLADAQKRAPYAKTLQDADQFLKFFTTVTNGLKDRPPDPMTVPNNVGMGDIQTFTDSLLPLMGTEILLAPGQDVSRQSLYEAVIHHIGLWLMIEDFFTITGIRSKWMTAYCQYHDSSQEAAVLAGAIGLRELIAGPRLLPVIKPRERMRITRKELNAHNVVKLGRIGLRWTTNITMHFKTIDDREGVKLMLFQLPCVLARNSVIDSR